jgi:hypothetical protein
MVNISKKNIEILKMLNGHEIQSINYEGIVYISGKNNSLSVNQDGIIIDYLNTNKKISNLWKEYMFSEGQYY